MIRTDPLSNESFFEVGNYEEIPINDKLIAYLMKETSLSGGTSSVDIIIPGSEAVQTYSFSLFTVDFTDEYEQKIVSLIDEY